MYMNIYNMSITIKQNVTIYLSFIIHNCKYNICGLYSFDMKSNCGVYKRELR